ncbi:MAG: hypothetical protein GY792_10585 [Gammaproteobacteria bacterium]|nr:hypothetical protein [Gammaproteobacteria bacterium]
MGVLSFSISIAMITVVLSVSISTQVGTISVRAGGMVGEAIMRTVDLLLSFPKVILALFRTAILGFGYGTLILAQEINSRDYIAAAEVLGCKK